MLKFIPAPDNAIAISLEGRITGEDLNSIMARLEFALNVFSTIDVFVETHRITGVELAALASYSARALPLFGKLGAFDRVAVVADQAWIRLATRLESAILPSISYRVFEPEQRDQALAWALHKDGRPPRGADPTVSEIDRAA